MDRNEFDNYNSLKLEDRILTSVEVNGATDDQLYKRIVKITKAANNKLKDLALSIGERNALLTIATGGVSAIKLMSRKSLVDFLLNVYPTAIADGSHRDLSQVNYFDVAYDPKNEVEIKRKEINEVIQTTSDFTLDIPGREYNNVDQSMGAIITDNTAPKEGFLATNKDKIIIGVGAVSLAALALHVFKSAKKS